MKRVSVQVTIHEDGEVPKMSTAFFALEDYPGFITELVLDLQAEMNEEPF